ncbi:hypothetical protein CPJCM30710_03100 [Clostridium polyendosporum]|uniref:Spermatogenesis-associated protein 20-like TRX domain-containing protein n=1 Tax=Clostridium polyendosporum TaxID=69208 RepID=A0A919VD59_9CLOT|nr:hypothetical protein CPJCM30710_03100 [Clostridium polyendosporum]
MESVKDKKSNKLINQKSPYLLQHAYNPVDWYPWGEEAFEKAEKEDKPIFLSIGYSTCHWCRDCYYSKMNYISLKFFINSIFFYD